MRKLLKYLSLALCACLCLATLTGCHGSRDLAGFEVPAEFDTSRNYEITFWAKNDTNVRQSRIYKQAIEDFQALYPNVTVKMRLYTDYGRIYSDVITNIATNTTPNVCITYPDHIATYLTGDNCVAPLDQLMTDEKYGLAGSELKFDGPSQDEIITKFLDEGKIGGEQYALPYMRSTEACYINKTFVEKLGFTVPEELTWDFIWEVSEAAMAKEADGETYKVNGQKVLLPFIYKSTDNMMIQMLAQKGAGYSTDDGEVLIFNDTTEELLYEITSHAATGAFNTFKIAGYPANYLNAGQCIFAIDSTAGATWMGTDAPLSDIAEEKLVQFETVVKPVPQFDPESPKMISQGPSICVFNKEDPQEVLAAWLFAQFLLTNDVQIPYAETEGYVPVTSKAQNSAEYQEYLSRAGEDNDEHYYVKMDATQLLLNNIGNTFVTPVFNGSADLRNAAGQLIENVVKAPQRDQTVDAAFMETLRTDVTALYHLDQMQTEATGGKADLGPLPQTAVILLACLAGAWILIVLYVVIDVVKRKKTR